MVLVEVSIPVEVEGNYGEFYPGLVTGLNSLEDLDVHLLDSSMSKTVAQFNVHPSSLRLPPDILSLPFEPVQGQEVDVLLGPTSTESKSENPVTTDSSTPRLSAWWPGRVKRVVGEFVIVELSANVNDDNRELSVSSEVTLLPNGRIAVPYLPTLEKTDIVEKHQLRPRSHRNNLSPSAFHVHPIDIPDELVQYCREPTHYQHFARRCGLPVLVCMAPESMRPSSPVKQNGNDSYNMRARLLVISTDISTVNRAAIIDNTFIDMLRQKVTILQQTEELSRKLEATRLSKVTPFTEVFVIPADLIHYALGAQYTNIKQARSIDGVLSIKLDRQTCTFEISGKTLEAVKKARELLDFTTEVVRIPRPYIGPILGSAHRHVQHIVDRVGLVGMKISRSDEEDQAYVSFQLTGRRQAIKDAKMFLEFHVASLQDIDRLRGIENPPSIPDSEESANPAGDTSGGQNGDLESVDDDEPINRVSRRNYKNSTNVDENESNHISTNEFSNEDLSTENQQNSNQRYHRGGGRQGKPRLQSNNNWWKSNTGRPRGGQRFNNQEHETNLAYNADHNHPNQARNNHHRAAPPRSDSVQSGRQKTSVPTAS